MVFFNIDGTLCDTSNVTFLHFKIIPLLGKRNVLLQIVAVQHLMKIKWSSYNYINSIKNFSMTE